jgi:ATP-dependent Lhr-like helicase
VSRYLHSATALDVLVQALLDAPLFAVRWRWNATTALALPRFTGGRKVAPQLQRMKSEDLLAAVFPDQVACAENLAGDREVPEHPLIAQTMRDCLDDAMDATGWLALLRRIESGAVEVVARDLPAPSPLAAEALSARPYAFLDDAPIEERGRRRCRTAATPTRERRRARPARRRRDRERSRRGLAEARNADEMHEALVALGVVADGEAAANAGWSTWLDELAASARATRLAVVGRPAVDSACGSPPSGWRRCATCIPMRALQPSSRRRPSARGFATRDEALARAAARAPRRPRSGDGRRARCAARLARGEVELAPARAAGRRLRAAGTLHAALPVDADVRVVRAAPARAHPSLHAQAPAPRDRAGRAARLRPLPVRLAARRRASRVSGPDALAGVLGQLEGFEAPAAVWEAEILPARVQDYASPWLDDLCTAGRTLWTRLRPLASDGRAAGASLRSTPVLLLPRRAAAALDRLAPSARRRRRPRLARAPRRRASRAHGASFFDEIADAVRLLPAELEDALAELVVPRPRQLRQLRRPARAARSGGEAIVGARAPAPRRDAARHRRRRPLVADPQPRRGDASGTSAAARARRRRRARARRAHPAAPLRRRLLAPARARGGVAAAVARPGACLPPTRGARRDPRRPLHRRPDRRAVRAARRDRLDARDPPPAGRRCAGLPRRERSGEPARHRRPGPKVARVAGARVVWRDGVPLATSVGGEIELLLPATAREARAIEAALRQGPTWRSLARSTAAAPA